MLKINRFHSGLPYISILLTILLISGCADKLVCRHQVLETASMGVEKHLETRISIYKVSHPLWDAHAQAQVKVDGEWKWMDDWFGYVILGDEPALTPTGYMLFYSIPEYLEVLRQGSYRTGEK
ncbi:MAG: hypothetical protein CVU71_16260 [Deltaproteobacteria bacterium HGW-Deltaproteobacteria-6]|jgi:hypothetical protein|nr:MAG: hypothetical protein CVU71_16260 [Deltaproteobacteria bacterium HGW-Deltaproteobacteria-6]